jgi:hypothetical protein
LSVQIAGEEYCTGPVRLAFQMRPPFSSMQWSMKSAPAKTILPRNTAGDVVRPDAAPAI